MKHLVGALTWQRIDRRLMFLPPALILLGLVLTKATPHMSAATVSYFCLCAGLLWRQNKRAHMTLMNLGIVLDLMIVLSLELQRNAINTALEFSLTPLQQAHIGASSVATALYIPILILGWMMFLRPERRDLRKWHLPLGVLSFIFRSLGFLLMFSLLNK